MEERPKDRVAASAAQTGSGAADAAARHSVLVVDDEENFLTLLQWFLTQRGYEVATAPSADQALRLVENRAFQVALLDIRLGSADGLALLDQLTQRVPNLKVFMMTAYPTVGSIKQAFDKGALRYLTKPVDLQELAEALRGVF
jgi:DNA-binding NtrC family response regulator